MERGTPLRRGSHGWSRGKSDRGGKRKDPRRRIHDVVGICERGEYRFAHLAAQCRNRRAILVAAKHNGHRFHVSAHGSRKRATRMAWPDAPLIPEENAAEDSRTC